MCYSCTVLPFVLLCFIFGGTASSTMDAVSYRTRTAPWSLPKGKSSFDRNEPFFKLNLLFFGSYIIMVIRRLSTTKVGKTTIFENNYSVPSPRPAISALWGRTLGEIFTVHTWPPLFCLQRQMVSLSASQISLTHCCLRPTPPSNALL